MPPRSQLTENAALSPAERGEGVAEDRKQGDVRTRPAALLFATTPAVSGDPAAALATDGTAIVARLLDQLASLGAARACVVTRPAWKPVLDDAVAESGLETTVVSSENVGDDLRLAADFAASASGPLVVANAHVLTHRQALAGLLADPRISSGVLVTSAPLKAGWSFPVRSLRARVVSAASPYHRAEGKTGYFLSVLKLDPGDRDRLVAASRELAEIAADPPASWEAELQRKEQEWRLREWRAAVERETGTPPDPADVPDPDALELDADAEARVAQRRRVAADDPLPLLLVGLVRSQVELFPSILREFFHAAPLSEDAAAAAFADIARSDEDRVLLNTAVKGNDGFFTTFFVSPYSKHLARFAARRGWTPNAVSTASFALGMAAAASFALGTRASLVAGALLLQISFTVDCVDGQLARYTRTFSKLGAWLDSVFDRTKEFLVYAGLALGSTRGFGEDVWLLAAAALAVQTARHMSDFAYVASQRRAVAATPPVPLAQPEDGAAAARKAPAADQAPRPASIRLALGTYLLLRRSGLLRWGNRIIRMPIGERFALISLTAALATPRVTFVALLVWGAVAGAYALGIRTLVSYQVPRRLVRAVLG